jgi:AraC-like DNA-binding protein
MRSLIPKNRLFFRDDSSPPLGRITFAGTIFNSPGVGKQKMRVFGQYAIVLVVGGGGFYRDILGAHQTVAVGDLIVVFPEIAHSYGPHPHSHWDEIYVCFDGEIFDLWRRQNLIDPSKSVITVENWSDFAKTLVDLLDAERPNTQMEHLNQLHRFLSLLGEVVLPTSTQNEAPWLLQAKSILQSDLNRDLSGEEVAQRVGLSYETFRKSFARECGVSPAQFRTRQRIEAAKTLLESTPMTHGAIARSLGFRDDAHFARRFKEITSQTPRDYRHQYKHH